MVPCCLGVPKWCRQVQIPLELDWVGSMFPLNTPNSMWLDENAGDVGDGFYDLLVVRVNPSGQLINSKPCCMCIYIMKLYGINKVYYSTGNGAIKCERVRDIEETHYSKGLIRCFESCSQKELAKFPLSVSIKRQIRKSLPSRIS